MPSAVTVALGRGEGLERDSVANADAQNTVAKSWLRRRLGEIGPEKRRRLDDALRFALGMPSERARAARGRRDEV